MMSLYKSAKELTGDYFDGYHSAREGGRQERSSLAYLAGWDDGIAGNRESIPYPCPNCPFTYDVEVLEQVMIGRVEVDVNPTHSCSVESLRPPMPTVLRPVLKQAHAWCSLKGILVLDPDGWRRGSALGERNWWDLISEEEFEARRKESTVGFVSEMGVLAAPASCGDCGKSKREEGVRGICAAWHDADPAPSRYVYPDPKPTVDSHHAYVEESISMLRNAEEIKERITQLILEAEERGFEAGKAEAIRRIAEGDPA